MKEDLVHRVKKLDERRRRLKTMIIYLEDGIDTCDVRMFFKNLMPKRLYDKLFCRDKDGVQYDNVFANEDMRECFLEFIKMKLEETEREINSL